MNNNNLEILFAGDFAPCRRYEQLAINKKEKIFGDALDEIISSDLSFVNLECPLTNSNETIEKSGPGLKANPKCFDALNVFDVIGLANNHIMDSGEQGLIDTINLCNNNNKKYVGAGSNLQESQKILYIKLENISLSIIALAEYEFNQAEINKPGSAPIDLIDNYQQIKEAKEKSDFIIVTMHAGNEYFPYPRPNLRKTCHHFIDLGVDAIICHHPHVPGAYEEYEDKPIFYSIGNFIFDRTKDLKEDWNYGYMVKLSISKTTKKINSFQLIPYEQSIQHEGIKLLQNDYKDSFLQKINTYKKNLEDEDKWLNEWYEFVNKKANIYILRQYLPFMFRGINFLSKYIPLIKVFINKKNYTYKLNMLRCQSHYEIFLESLKLKTRNFKK